jgi:RNA polymerase sigma-70 factor (ECF subfamily)
MGRWAPPEIIAAAQTGDQSAAEQLVAAVWPACFRLAAALSGDRSLAQDAAQESCVIVYRKIRTLRNVASFDSWLYRIVTRESVRVRRRRDILVEPFEQCAADDATASIDVWRALAQLSPEQREATVLFYFHDLKSDDIATILRIPHATVRTRLARARERLRGLLDDYANLASPQTRETKQHAF